MGPGTPEPVKRWPRGTTSFHPSNQEVQSVAQALSCGRRTRAGSTTKPRAWAYSTKAWLSRGSRAPAPSTMALRLSGITVANTPVKNRHAASKPSITASVVWAKVSHTKQWRE